MHVLVGYKKTTLYVSLLLFNGPCRSARRARNTQRTCVRTDILASRLNKSEVKVKFKNTFRKARC